MAFAFSITALAEGEEDIVVLPPVDPGLNEETGYFENIDVELDAPLPPDVEGYIDAILPGELDDEWPDYNEDLLEHVEGYKNSPAYNDEVVFDAIQYIGRILFEDALTGDNVNPGIGGWVTVINKDWNINTVKAILQWFQDEEYILITSDQFEYDPVTGTLRFYVEDFGFWSEFFALIERGVDPVTAMQVLNAKSPKTEDTSIHAGIILLIVLSAATATVVISKKARKHD